MLCRRVLLFSVLFSFLLVAPSEVTGKPRRPSNKETEKRAMVVDRCAFKKKRSYANRSVSKLRSKRSSKYSDIVVIEDDGTLLEDDEINLCAVAKSYYAQQSDDRHFLFVFAQGGKDYADGYNAYYWSLRNAVEGIGREVFDSTTGCGSKGGVLLGLANMNGTDKWKAFTAPVLDLWPLGVIVHELGHQWIAALDEPVNGERLTTEAGAVQGHWQPLVDTNASIMYGNRWRKIGKKKFFSSSFPKGFSTLDKYLMGVLPASKVDDLFVIKAEKSKIGKHYARPGNTAKGDKVNITIEDIQKVYGARSPSYKKAQKKFKAAFVLVVPKGEETSNKALRVVNYFRKRIPKRLSKVTDKVFEISTSLD